MITRISLFILVAAAPVFALTTDSVNKQFDATALGKSIGDVEFGNIDVNAGTDDKVSIEASRKIDSNDEVKEGAYFAAVPIAIREIGVRLALGVRRADIRVLTLGHGLRLIAIGLLLGLTTAFACSRLLGSFFFEVSAVDPSIYAAVSGMLALTSRRHSSLKIIYQTIT